MRMFDYNAILKRCGLFVEQNEQIVDVAMRATADGEFYGEINNLKFAFSYTIVEKMLTIKIHIKNDGEWL